MQVENFGEFQLLSLLLNQGVKNSRLRVQKITEMLKEKKQLEVHLATKLKTKLSFVLISSNNLPKNIRKTKSIQNKKLRKRPPVRRLCTHLGCPKFSQGPGTFCFAHGGGYRCLVAGCTKASRDGSRRCISHGGGKKCTFPGCSTSSRGKSRFCIRHSKMCVKYE
eukprot:snap_masked-scaffold_38-processed-gene-1.37-mRNA-1 protein AED:0.26 eAED:0.27 QI:0/-1/0/1/-1/1/1/0/164